ncbi:MAG: response regulator transcription factor [Saprospiraceae bacterium]|nr:response regulator transcription factor [Saprospiraceae bacterium]
MTKLKCIVIEDEPLAAEGLEAFIREVPSLEFVATFPDALSTLELMNRQQVDVIFLDIHLPKLKGLDFLRSLKNPPQVILTTAYHQYAIESYELNVVDYLLKPFGFPRFLAAVNKLMANDVQSKIELAPAVNRQPSTVNRPNHFFNENKRQVKVYHDEILYVESLKEYVKLVLLGGRTVITRFQLGEFETQMNDPNLVRIHRSYLVAKDKIEAFSATEVEIGGVKLPIGRVYQGQIQF